MLCNFKMDFLCPLLEVFCMILVIVSSQSPPGGPDITGPDSVLSGTEVTLQCSSSGGSPAPTVKWFENDTEIVDGVSTITNSSMVTAYLTYIASKKAYFRFFLCQVNNSELEKPMYANTFVVVYYLPDVTASPALQFVNTSVSPVTILCSVSAIPVVKIYTWRKISLDGKRNITIDEKESEGKYSIIYYDTSSKLEIYDIIFSDDANYVCFAENAVGIGVSNNARVDVIGSTPQVSIPQSAYSVTYGANITIPCTIVGAFPAHFRVTWFYRNRENQVTTVNIGDHTQYSGGTLNTPALTILNTNKEDAGFYTCVAENQVDSAQSNETLLNVLAEPIAIHANNTQYYPIQNTTITLHCKVTQGIALEIQWYKDISVLNVKSNLRLSGGDVATESLTIVNVQRSDEGIYICQATDAVYDTIVNTDTIHVNLAGLPVLEIYPTNYTATYGTQVDIDCYIVYSRPAVTSVFWKRSSDNHILRIDRGDSGYQGSTPKIPSLTINIATTSDAGKYTCHATNDIGTNISNTGIVTITGGLLSTSVSPRTSDVVKGDSVKINCTVTGLPPATNITWLFTAPSKTKQWVLSTTNINNYTFGTTKDPYLIIRNFQLGDSGTFVCRATNLAGSTSSNPGSNLTYISIPSISVEPSQFTATVGDISFMIRCTVTAIPEAITWYWTFQPVDGIVQTIPQGSNNQQYTIESSGINPHLTIKNIAFEEAGVYTCYATNAAGASDSASNRTGNSHLILTVTGDGKNICEEDIDKFYTKWRKALEKTLSSVPCTGEYNGSVSRYCNDGGQWDNPDYSQCIRKSIEYLQDQSAKLLYGESVDTIFLLENLENLTKESNKLRSGDLVASANVLNDIALYDKYHADRLSVDQLESFISICNDLLDERNHQSWEELKNEENSVTRVLKAVSAYNSIFYEMIHGEFTISFKKKNIVIELGKTRSVEITVPGCSQTSDWLGNLATEIKLKKNKNSELTGYSSTFYQNISRLFPEYFILDGKVQSFNESYDVNSIITDFTVGTTSSPDYILNIKFDHLLDNYSRPFCGFWDFHVSNAVKGAWSSFGSRIVKSTDSYTICEYNHTTNFAILMSPGRIPKSHNFALSLISAVGCGVSIFFLVITILIHYVLWGYVKNDKTKILMNLCVALILSYVIFLAGITRTEIREVCTAIAVALHYMFLTDFCLMLAEGIQIVRMVVIVFSTRSIIHWLLPLCWIAPVIIVGISAGVTQLEGYGNFQFCWLSLETNLIWAFIGPALLVVLINVVIFVIMVHKMLTSRGIAGKTLKEKSKIGLKSICIILPLFGVTWVLGAVSVNDDLVMFQYLFAIFNSLQGFFICLFHCFYNKQVRQGYNHYQRRRKSNRLDSKLSTNLTNTDNTKRTTKYQQQYMCSKEESQERM